jgi:hypothetical protein
MIVQRKNVPLREESQLPKNETTHLAALTREEFVQEAGSGDDEGESTHGEVGPVGRHVAGSWMLMRGCWIESVDMYRLRLRDRRPSPRT